MKLSVADYVARQIGLCGKTQKDIAAEVGWPKPNMVTMVKQGQVRVPIDKAPALAKSLGLDPAHFTRMVMREYMPDAWRAIESTFGEALTGNERRLVFVYRDICGDEEIPFDDAIVRDLLRACQKRIRAPSARPRRAL